MKRSLKKVSSKFRKVDAGGAFKLYRGFRERQPTKAKVVKYKTPRVVMVLGHLESVCYRTTHGKDATLEAVRYEHKFSSGSRPLLCAGPGKNELYIVGGRYRVTERGITDLDARGRLILDPEHGAPAE